MQVKSVSILGAGWLGQALIPTLRSAGFKVCASSRTPEKLPALESLGAHTFQVILEDGSTPDILPADFFKSDYLILSIPPGRYSADRGGYAQKIERLLAVIPSQTQVIFLSSTSVYGEAQGICSEEITPQPDTPSGSQLLLAEQRLQNALGKRLCILRLAGLAGPGRHPGRWLAGREGLPDGNKRVNLIHQEDCVGVLHYVLNSVAAWGEIFNICADEHPLKRAYYPLMATQLGLTPPTYLDTEGESDRKIISNNKLKSILGYTLKKPDPFLFF